MVVKVSRTYFNIKFFIGSATITDSDWDLGNGSSITIARWVQDFYRYLLYGYVAIPVYTYTAT